jgi:hypothetical protein
LQEIVDLQQNMLGRDLRIYWANSRSFGGEFQKNQPKNFQEEILKA